MEDVPTRAPQPQAAAEYLADLAEEMVDTSNRSGLPFLAYLFSMACAEARVMAGRVPRQPAPSHTQVKEAPAATALTA